MVLCDTCKHLGNMASWPCEDCLQGDRYERKPTTNADRIRAMTDEEIEEWYWWMYKEMPRYTNSYVFVHNWLKQEVESDG